MHIVIDLQGAQSESRFRGIGRYSLSLAKAIVRNCGTHDVTIALSGFFPETIPSLRQAFEGLLPRENIRVWYSIGPVRGCEAGNQGRREIAELMRESFLASLKPDIVLVTSMFEGFIDNAVTSVGQFDQGSKTAVILYDLIPLLNPETYLPTGIQQDYYFRKISTLKKAGLLLAISDSSSREAIEKLDLPADRVVNISAAVDDLFQPGDLSENEMAGLKIRYRITRRMVLYVPGGFDVRKNFSTLFLAYAQLPKEIRAMHQLVIVSKGCVGDCENLLKDARQANLKKDEVILTGYVPDQDLMALYRMAVLFVFPSRHEGFGLPVLEAMSCGAPTIGSNTTSIPEVIGNPDALFDPESVDSTALKMMQALNDDEFRKRLSTLAVKQARHFSWDKSARRALRAMEEYVARPISGPALTPVLNKLRLAFVSPLPPEPTGIADYSADLLPALSRCYQIDVVVAQPRVTDPWVTDNCAIRTPDWFLDHAGIYDRVLYHFGNSPFHHYMVDLLKAMPGVVCLHDFYLSSYSSYMELVAKSEFRWIKDLYTGHGYQAVYERCHNPNPDTVKFKYPCNFFVLQSARGIIVHSEYSRHLAEKWYGINQGRDWQVIPLLRRPPEVKKKFQGNGKKDFPPNACLVCSFGALDSTKLNHRLLTAWLNSRLADDPNCHLIFVGKRHGGEYGRDLMDRIKKRKAGDRIHITDWVGRDAFQDWLETATIAVQLRTLSRGETSAAVLDCMNHGLPTIVNAHGSNAELPEDAVWMLPDEFEDHALITALETLWQDPLKRNQIGRKAKETVQRFHDPDACAGQYAAAIEKMYGKTQADRSCLLQKLAGGGALPHDDSYLRRLAVLIAHNQPDQTPGKTLFVDVSATYYNDLKAGIDRVSRSLLLQLIQFPPAGFRTEPVYLTDHGGAWHYRHARAYTLKLLDCPGEWIRDEAARMGPGDLLFGSDLSGNRVVEAEKSGLFLRIGNEGVGIVFTVFDMLPVQLPGAFPPGADQHFMDWLRAVCKISHQVVCISKAVAHDVFEWCKADPYFENIPRPRVEWFHLGADLDDSFPTTGLPDDATTVLEKIKNTPSFLMVGTIEPRKGHLQAIAAFERLWKQKQEISLVIVGKEGWQHLPDGLRRTIPRTATLLRSHPERNRRLFWLEDISDEYLEKVYAASSCLIAASEGEGFGLPLIEAARHKLPVIARDIPIFREVAGTHAFYFNGLTSDALADAVLRWLEQYAEGDHPKSDGMPWQTWRKSALRLTELIVI